MLDTHTHICIYIYVKESKRTHRFSVTPSFASRRSSDRTLFNEGTGEVQVAPLAFVAVGRGGH